MQQVRCPHCRNALTVPANTQGQQFRCAFCGGVFHVPPATVVAPPPISPAALRPPHPTAPAQPRREEPTTRQASTRWEYWLRFAGGLFLTVAAATARIGWRCTRAVAIGLYRTVSKKHCAPASNRSYRGHSYGAEPTEKQLGFARRLGIEIPKGVTRGELSGLIDAAQEADPKFRARRQKEEEEEARRRLEFYGPELLKLEARWQALADGDCCAAFVYRRGKKVQHALGRPYQAELNEKKPILLIACERAKIKREAYIGHIVDIDGEFEIASDAILWHEVHEGFEWEDVETFRRLEEKAKKLAAKKGG